MQKTALALLAAAAVGFTALAAPSPAEAHWRGGFGPGLAGGLVAGALLGGLAPAYAYSPRYGYYDDYAPPVYGYAPAYYGGYAPRYYRPAYYGPRLRRIVRPAYAYYGGPRYYHRWHGYRHHW